MVVYLNGPINSGKTTIAKLLTALIPRAVNIEIDDLPTPLNLPLEESIEPLLRDAADLAINWHRRGFHPIVGWPISQEDHARFATRMVGEGARLYTFTLAPRLEIALVNRGTRDLTEWERERIRFHYAQGIHRPSFGHTLDNTDESPRDTVRRIIDGLPEDGAVF